MIQETHIESRRNRESYRDEFARGIVGAGVLAIAYCGVLALLRRKKLIFLRPIIAFVFLLLALALLGSCLKVHRSSRPD
jgi:NO-binding membrane sensor protein with MHYT domain